jgi:hypothetical protein
MLKLKSYWIQFTGWSLVISLLAFGYFESYNPYGWVFWGPIYLSLFIAISLLGIAIYKCFKERNIVSGVLLTISIVALTSLISLIAIDYRLVTFRDTITQLSKQEWKNDILYLKKSIKARHPGVETLISMQKFESEFNHVLDNLSMWEDNKIKAEIMHLVTMLNDGHSIVPPQPAINYHCLPIVTHKFDDGVYVVDAARTHKHLLNAKIVKIGNASIETVFKKLAPYIGAENTGNKWDRFPLYGSLTELLYELGVSNSLTSTDMTYVKDGQTITEAIEGTPYYEWYLFYLSPDRKNNPLPFEHRMLDDSYWFEYDELTKTLYVNINNLKDQSSEPIWDFSIRLANYIEEVEIDKTIVDLRNNRGGDNFKARAIANAVKNSVKINQDGKLFTLISRRTFSAAVNLATILENQTKTIFVGEPTGQGPTQFGDAASIKLPNSGIHVFLSTLKWQGSFPQDNRQSIEPDYQVEYKFSDFINGHDPALAFISTLDLMPKSIAVNPMLEGRYIINDDQAVTIINDSTGLRLLATDYIPGSLRDINTALYAMNDSTYSSDVNGLTLCVQKQHLDMVFYNDTIPLIALDGDFKFPLQLIEQGDFADGIRAISNNLEMYKNYSLEGYFNRLGYTLFRKGEVDLAEHVFEINTQLYPYSGNVWDSYGEVLMGQDKLEMAKMAYKKSADLDPSNGNAKDMLIRLN